MTFVDVLPRCIGLSVAAALVVQLGSPGLARAQQAAPTASDFESARELFRRGKELRASGKVQESLTKFEAAHTYGQTPITGLELGRTHAQLGHLLEAREVLLSVARLKIAADESDNSAQARREARELAEEIRPRLANLTVSVGQADHTVVTLDGAAIPVIAGAIERVVNPGRHVLSARIRGGSSRNAEVVLAEGERRSLDLTPASPGRAGSADSEATIEPVPPSTQPTRDGGVHPLVFIGFGTALAGTLVGTVTGIAALNKGHAANQACGAAGGSLCIDEAARASAEDLQRAGRPVAIASTVSFVIAGTGAVAGIVGLFLPRGEARSARIGPGIRPLLGLGYAGLGGRF